MYCFDSSFPLLFQSRYLWSLLDERCEIVIGFDYEAVAEAATGECLSVMTCRTATVLRDVTRNLLFRAFGRGGPVTSFDQSELQDWLRANGGYAVLRKY
jgi:hypothetical protein